MGALSSQAESTVLFDESKVLVVVDGLTEEGLATSTPTDEVPPVG